MIRCRPLRAPRARPCGVPAHACACAGVNVSDVRARRRNVHRCTHQLWVAGALLAKCGGALEMWEKVGPVSVPCRFSDDVLPSAPQPGYAGEACMKLVVTIPALNEEKTIAHVVAAIPRNIPGIHDVEVIV